MDKIYTKIIVDREGIDQAHFVKVLRKELSTMDSVVERIEKIFPILALLSLPMQDLP